MPYSIFRYYYFLEDDLPRVEQFTEILNSNDFAPHSAVFDPGRWHNRLLYGNMIVLVAAISDETGWEASQTQLENWESQARVKSDLLARVTVLLDSSDSFDSSLEAARRLCPYRDIIPFGTRQGQLARLDWKWPRGQAYYLYNDPVPGKAANFFSSGLPLLEAALIRLNLVSNLYRDRHATVDKERQEMDKQLSHILHTQLVSDKAPLKEADELEAQIQELAASYGILAGDYSTLSEAASKIQELIKAVTQHVRTQTFLKLEPELLTTILQPYQERLRQLQKSQEDLDSSRENHRAAIDVVRSRIDIMMSRENIETQERIKDLMEINTAVQKQSLIFQVAAGIIEFIVLAYYSHSLWKALVHNAYALIPPWLQFIVVLLFSYNTVQVTHLVAEYRQGDHHVKGKLIAYGISLALILTIIIAGSVLMEAKSAH
ncbi:MAG: hypothetical protein ABFD04_15140 [Syntrophomonas sp.]